MIPTMKSMATIFYGDLFQDMNALVKKEIGGRNLAMDEMVIKESCDGFIGCYKDYW